MTKRMKDLELASTAVRWLVTAAGSLPALLEQAGQLGILEDKNCKFLGVDSVHLVCGQAKFVTKDLRAWLVPTFA